MENQKPTDIKHNTKADTQYIEDLISWDAFSELSFLREMAIGLQLHGILGGLHGRLVISFLRPGQEWLSWFSSGGFWY